MCTILTQIRNCIPTGSAEGELVLDIEMLLEVVALVALKLLDIIRLLLVTNNELVVLLV